MVSTNAATGKDIRSHDTVNVTVCEHCTMENVPNTSCTTEETLLKKSVHQYNQ